MWATPMTLGGGDAADDAPLAPVCATQVEINRESNTVCNIFMARDGGLPSAQLSSSGGKGTRQYSEDSHISQKTRNMITRAESPLYAVILKKRSRSLARWRAAV